VEAAYLGESAGFGDAKILTPNCGPNSANKMNPESLLQYPFAQFPPPGETFTVAPGVHWLRMPLPFALDHINLWLLEDGAQWVIVDCGFGNDATRALWKILIEARIGMAGVSRVIATHHHPDHVGNAGWLTRQFAAPLWIPQAEYLSAHAICDGAAGYSREQLAALYRRNGLDEAHVPGILKGSDRYRQSVPDFPTSYRRICEGDSILIGSHAWRVIMGYGHAPEHAALYCESLGVLISGDMLLPRISTNVSVPASQPEANPLRLFLESLSRYATLPAQTLVLPSHGLPFRGMHERIAQLKEHHRLRLGELLEACKAPKCAAEVLGVLFRRQLDSHQMLFAMGESMAHLHYLHEEGTLRRIKDETLIRYQRV
jgi:glyoxylase-like metal-dependent hydrolase (beta-lactamase superfamily II)